MSKAKRESVRLARKDRLAQQAATALLQRRSESDQHLLDFVAEQHDPVTAIDEMLRAMELLELAKPSNRTYVMLRRAREYIRRNLKVVRELSVVAETSRFGLAGLDSDPGEPFTSLPRFPLMPTVRFVVRGVDGRLAAQCDYAMDPAFPFDGNYFAAGDLRIEALARSASLRVHRHDVAMVPPPNRKYARCQLAGNCMQLADVRAGLPAMFLEAHRHDDETVVWGLLEELFFDLAATKPFPKPLSPQALDMRCRLLVGRVVRVIVGDGDDVIGTLVMVERDKQNLIKELCVTTPVRPLGLPTAYLAGSSYRVGADTIHEVVPCRPFAAKLLMPHAQWLRR